MLPSIEGGAILNGSSLDGLLIKPGVVGIAIKSIGRSPRQVPTAEVEVFALYWKNGEFIYNNSDKSKSIDGRNYERTSRSDINNYFFEHNAILNSGNFCFCYFRKEDIRNIIGHGSNYNDLFISSVKLSRRRKDIFSLCCQLETSLDENEGVIINGAPCPPFWQPGPPIEGVSSNKSIQMSTVLSSEEIKALKKLAKSGFC